jgi:hypothetical protein
MHGPAVAVHDAAVCLSRHGWRVTAGTSGVVVANNAPYSLVYEPSRNTGPIVQTGWSGYGPTIKSPLYYGEGATKIPSGVRLVLPACFTQYAHSIHTFASSNH